MHIQPLYSSPLTLGELVLQTCPNFRIAVIGPNQYIKDFLYLIGIENFTEDSYNISTHKNKITFVTQTNLFIDIDFAIILDMHNSHAPGNISPSLQSIKHSEIFLRKSPFTPIIYVRTNSNKTTCTSSAIKKIFIETQKCKQINSYKLHDYYYDIPTSDWDSIICVNLKKNKCNIINELCYPVRIYNLCKLCATMNENLL
jgi:hypothetical protein